ncbi:MAG: TonB-dependent receptor [Bacteroidota bacterium]
MNRPYPSRSVGIAICTFMIFFLSMCCLSELRAEEHGRIATSIHNDDLLVNEEGEETLFQQFTVSGVITDETGVGLPGATVVEKGTTNGTITDIDGRYSISLPEDAVIVITYIGYETSEINVGGQNVIDFQMAVNEEQLEEVVVIGYGTAKKSDLSGSVASIDPTAFQDQPLTRTESALQGRAAGVTVARQTGAPGGDVKVRIRGTNSITGGNNPLIVIDGLLGGDLSTINPNDIESINVLKDASATAVYGSRGANGVIVVTTKRGAGKMKISMEYFTAISTVPDYLESLGRNPGDFARVQNIRARANNPNVAPGDIEFPFSASRIDSLDRGIGVTDYQEELFRVGVSQNAQLSASGGNDKFNYYLSANYQDEEGIIINNNYKRFILRSNLQANVNEKLSIGLNTMFSREETKNDPGNFFNIKGTPVLWAATWDPLTPLFDAEGEFNIASETGIASQRYNPVAAIRSSDFNNTDNRAATNINIVYDITDELSFSVRGGGSFGVTSAENLNVSAVIVNANHRNQLNFGYQMSNILTYNKSFGNHNITGTGLFEVSGGSSRINSYFASDLTGPLGFYHAEISNATTFGNNFTNSSIHSYMGRVAYNFKRALYVTGTVRNDISSRFDPDRNSAVFFSFAGSYNFRNTAFIQNNPILSGLKARVGWGEVGNQAINIFGRFPTVVSNATYDFGGGLVRGSEVTRFGNESITWETTTQLNAGVDIGLFDDKVTLTVDVYRKNTTDLLLDATVPETLAGQNVRLLENRGEVQNQGIDLSAVVTPIRTKNWSWESTIAMSFIQNEVISLGDTLTELQTLGFESIDGTGVNLNVIEVGRPLGEFRGANFLGTWKTTDDLPSGVSAGDAKYVLDEDGNPVMSNVGNGTPTFTWGFNNTVRYKNWDLNMFWTGASGFNVYNQVRASIVGGSASNQSLMHPEALNLWTPENETDIPATGANLFASDRYVEKGDFVRLSNLTIGYTFRNVTKAGSIKVYASGQNLLLFTDYTGFDPELSDLSPNGRRDTDTGIDIGAYPNPRVYTLGVKANF